MLIHFNCHYVIIVKLILQHNFYVLIFLNGKFFKMRINVLYIRIYNHVQM